GPTRFSRDWSSDVCSSDLHFVDCPGFAVGVKHERAATVKLGVQAMAAVYQARVPWCSIVVRAAYGLAGSAMMNPTRVKYRYCWPDRKSVGEGEGVETGERG